MDDRHPAVTRPLAALDRARDTLVDYYSPLLDDEDEIIRVGAWFTLLTCRELPATRIGSDLDKMGGYGATRRMVFDLLESRQDHARAAAVVGAPCGSAEAAETDCMRAELSVDFNAAADAKRRLYLATGQLDALFSEAEFAYRAGGAARALPTAIRNVVINPHEPRGAIRLLEFSEELGGEMLSSILEQISAKALHPYTTALYSASLALRTGKPAEALSRLSEVRSMQPFQEPRLLKSLSSKYYQLRAECIEALGDFKGALDAYLDMKKGDGAPRTRISLQDTVNAARRIAIPTLPADPHANWFKLVGFPRSGTTLIENALAAHPAVQTFEEFNTRAAVTMFLEQALVNAGSAEDHAAIFMEARDRYYLEMTRVGLHPGAKVFIDKMPIDSADASLLSRLFPDKRYIFAVRHPFDVVLSCLKQNFVLNLAMQNFTSFEDTVAFYDFTMREWFAVHSMNDPHVRYIRYDDVVTNFHATVSGLLQFLGLDWDPRVEDFAQRAAERASMTPSYQKVRQGLSLGVQSNWRNYEFLFRSEAARPLMHWVKHFGYGWA